MSGGYQYHRVEGGRVEASLVGYLNQDAQKFLSDRLPYDRRLE